MQNWQQYKQFMPVGMIDLFEDKYYWKMPSDIEIDIGPTAAGSLREGLEETLIMPFWADRFHMLRTLKRSTLDTLPSRPRASQAPWVSRTRAELPVPHRIFSLLASPRASVPSQPAFRPGGQRAAALRFSVPDSWFTTPAGGVEGVPAFSRSCPGFLEASFTRLPALPR
jgi:hypothetical protein